MIALLAMPLVAVTGCGSSNSVEIPTDPVPKSPGRPTGTNEGDGAEDPANGVSAPPADAPPE